MPLRTGCSARQYSDQMHCHKCGLVWDVNDPEPPECQPKPTIERAQEKREKSEIVSPEKAQQYLAELRRSLST